MPSDAGVTDVNSLTPQQVRGFAEPARDAVAVAYNEALTPIFLLVVPLMLASVVLLAFIRERSLTDQGDAEPETRGLRNADERRGAPREQVPMG